jgi:hypothetical protein
MLDRHIARTGAPPRQTAADGGHASRANLAAAKARGVADVAFHKKCGIAIPEMVKSPWVYRRLRNFRAGIEAAISYLKRAYGAARCTWRGTGPLQGLHLVRRSGAQPNAVRPAQTGLAAPDCKPMKTGKAGRPQLLVCRFPSRWSLPRREIAPSRSSPSALATPLKNTPLWTRTS